MTGSVAFSLQAAAVCGNTVEHEGVFRAGGACVARDRARVQTRENKKSKEVTLMPDIDSCGQLQPQTVAESNHKTTHQKNSAFLRKQAGRTEGPAQSAVHVGSLYLAGANRGMKL